MKKITILICLMIISSSIIYSQSNTDISPNIKKNPKAPTLTDDLFDHQFDFQCEDCRGEAGIETNGEFIYTSKWNGAGFFCYEIDGTYIGYFTVQGTATVRDMAFDGTYFYGTPSSTQLFEMDFNGASGVLISTLTAAVNTRAIAYDPDWDGFWGNDWSSDITLYDRSGSVLNSFPCGLHSSYYGFAMVNCPEGEYLYGFAQTGGANSCDIVQIDPYTGEETGVVFDAIGYSSSGSGVAGGLASFDTYVPGWWTLLGIIQNETIFGVEGDTTGSPPDLDLVLTDIIEPNDGFGLGIENIVIGVKNRGSITQTNFDVRYKVDNGEWITETIPGPLTLGETIEHTFADPYDFSVFGIYLINAEVILQGDELPDNNLKEKIIVNYDSTQWCEYSIEMWDDYGDGWNGGYVEIYGGSLLYGTFELASGAGPETVYFNVCNGSFMTAVWYPGGWPYESSYLIYDYFGNLIFEDGVGGVDPVGGDIGWVSCEANPPIDAGVLEIISPVTGFNLSMETVTILAKNFGGDTLSQMEVAYNINGGEWINEYIQGPISPNEEVEYSFNTLADLSAFGTYIFESCSFVPGDSDPLNDCATPIEVENIDPNAVCDFSIEMWDDYGDGWNGCYVEIYGDDILYGTFDLATGTGPDTVYFQVYEGAFMTTVWYSGGWPYECFYYIYDAQGNIVFEDGVGGVDPTGGDVGYVSCQPSEPPVITLNPSSFDLSLDAGATAQEILTIGNIGPGPLEWVLIPVYPSGKTIIPNNVNENVEPNASITDKDPIGFCILSEFVVPWLTVSPLAGYVEPQGSEVVTLDFNAGGYPAGTILNADLVITSNDLVTPEIIIPVQLNIDSLSPFQEINLSNGYQFISSNIIPPNPEIVVIMADILTENLDFVRNSQGQVLRKIGPVWVNNIGDWITEEGYLVKMFAQDSFIIEGEIIYPSTPILVEIGFQFVSYFPNVSMDALFAFEAIIGDDLDFIRNSTGQMVHKIGYEWINGIGDCNPTEGYLVKMLANGEIIYPESVKSSGRTIAVPTHFVFEGGNAADPVYTIYIEGFNIGDEIAAFDGDILVGAMKINSHDVFDNDLPIFSTLNSGQGYIPGNTVILKVWDALSQSLIPFEYSMTDPYNEAYLGSIYPDKDGLYSIISIRKSSIFAENNIVVYPNPAKNKITIQSFATITNVLITNCIGQVIFNESQNNSTININTESFESGIYLIRIESGNSIIYKKLIIEQAF